jgi:predicted metal-binding protein
MGWIKKIYLPLYLKWYVPDKIPGTCALCDKVGVDFPTVCFDPELTRITFEEICPKCAYRLSGRPMPPSLAKRMSP